MSCYENDVYLFTYNQPLRLEGNCLGCVGVSFNWTVIRDDGEYVKLGDETTATGVTEANLAIYPYALSVNHSYSFRLSVDSIFLSAGMAQLDLLKNKPPSGGTCTIDSTHVIALEEKVHIQCSDWVDSDENSVLTYSIIAQQPENPDNACPLYRGPISEGGYYVSPWSLNDTTVTISVFVIDRLGASTLALVQ